jgi:lactoylglutathione lyase
MQLAKPALDVGLYTNQIDAMLAFWQQQAQVPFAELLKVGGGHHQHRHAIGDSVLKINHTREPVPNGAPSGLRRLEIFSDTVAQPLALSDPDGNDVLLKPVDPADPQNLRLHMLANDAAAAAAFYGEVLGLPGSLASGFRVGASSIHIDEGTVAKVERQALGYRYMTMQVFDVVGTHQEILARGGSEGMAPIRLGEVAYISFVCDPDGNWIEISQRKSITGSLD